MQCVAAVKVTGRLQEAHEIIGIDVDHRLGLLLYCLGKSLYLRARVGLAGVGQCHLVALPQCLALLLREADIGCADIVTTT
ncbi:MAG: hypothetical protein ACREYE_30965 [Gammaproteobacteria bacterium]